ncbi:MAG: alpha-L-fucosidase [Mucinivorans sp.]
MKHILLNFMTLAAFVSLSSFTVKPPEPVYPIPTAAQVEWQKMEQYAFVHYGLNTFNNMEWGYGDTSADTFDPKNLDAEQWVKIFKDMGLKGVILTVKHHDGFCLWPSKYTEYSVKNSPWKNGQGDMVRDVVDACKKYGLKFGIYLSPWDRNHAKYGTAEYVEYFHNQIRELLGNYCDSVEMFEYWFDGANGGDGYYGGAREHRNIDASTYYKYDEAVGIINKQFPRAMIFGGTVPTIRWVGNEAGWAGQTSWSMYGSPKGDYKAEYGSQDGAKWLPSEVDVSIRPGWFYHQSEDHQVRSVSNLVDLYYQSVGRNSSLLLSFPVGISGTVHPIDSARVMQYAAVMANELKTDLLCGVKVEASSSRGGDFTADKVNDGNWDTYFATSDGVANADITFTFNDPTTINRLMLQEYIPLGQRVKSFAVDYFARGAWHPIPTADTMTTVGYKRILRFKNVTAEKLRVSFKDARGPLTINNISAYLAPALMSEPVISRDRHSKVTIRGGDGSVALFYTLDGKQPTENSTRYVEPFVLTQPAVVKAIAQDESSQKRFSEVSIKQFDVPTTNFVVQTKGTQRDAQKMLDSNPWTSYTLPSGENSVTIKFDKDYLLTGFTYLPDQSREKRGLIHSYELWVGDKRVAAGEFSNIKANPIEQLVVLEQPIRTDHIRFVVKSLVSGVSGRGVIAEFGIRTGA